MRTNESEEHKREKDAWSDAADTAGYPAEQEVRFNTGVTCDVVIYGPAADIDIEVQRYHLTTPRAQERTRRAVKAGLMPLWSTDRQTDWTRRNAVPHIRTNELPEHTIRDHWLVVGGMREVVAERCQPGTFQVCPDTGKGVFCGDIHAKLIPPADGNYRVYQVAELAPAGGLVALNTGRRQGTVLVSPEHRDLWNELTAVPAQRSRATELLQSQPPHHCDLLRPGFGAVIDDHIANRPMPQPTVTYRPSPTVDPRNNRRLYSPTGAPWCHFEAGTLYCVNDPCHNPNHRQRRG